MSKLINVLFVLLFLVLGPVLISDSCKAIANSRRLKAEAKTASGTVMGASESQDFVRTHSLLKSYALKVAFSPSGSEELVQDIKVDKNTYKAGAPGMVVTVHYLPSDPTICAVGEKVTTPFKGLAVGFLMVIGAVVLAANVARVKGAA